MRQMWVSTLSICFTMCVAACSSDKTPAPTSNGTAGTSGMVGVANDGGTAPTKDSGTADSGSKAQPDAAVTTPANPDFDPGTNDPSKKPADDTPISGPAMPSAVCGTPYRNFDTSGFEPVNAPQFKAAWDAERRASEVPGLVFAFRDLLDGPARLQVGSVHGQSNPQVFSFNTPGSQDMITPSVTKTPGTVNFAVDERAAFTVAFGARAPNSVHRAFTVSRITLSFAADGFCEEIAAGSSFTLRIPDTNKDLPFGGSTVGALLGAPFVDSNTDNVPDAWDVTFRGGTNSVVILSQ